MSGKGGRQTTGRLRLFGAFDLQADDGRSIPIRGRRGRAIIAYLYLLPNHKESRDRLADLLWTDRADAQARASLRQCMFDIRKDLSQYKLDLFVDDPELVCLKGADLVSEIDILVDNSANVSSSAVAAALNLIGSTRLLEGLELDGEFGDWLGRERSRIDRLIGDSVRKRLERLEALGEWDEVREIAEAYARRDSADEPVAAAGIRADAATGNTSAAHRRYLLLKDAMRRELGVDPGQAAREALGGPKSAVSAAGKIAATVSPSAPSSLAYPPLVVVAHFEEFDDQSSLRRLPSTIREEIVSGLSRFTDLRIITDPRPIDRLEVGPSEELLGAYGLGAGFRAGADGARLTVRLVRLGDGRTIWSEQFAAGGTSIVGTIDGIIAKTVGGVLPKINADLLSRPSHLPVDSTYWRYLVAREAAMTAPSFEAAGQAAQTLEALIRDHPDFALPYLPLAYLYNTDFHTMRAGAAGPDLFARALALAKRALAIDRNLAHAYTVAGWCYLRRRSWSTAKDHFEQALDRNFYHPTRVMEVAYGLLFLGDLERSEHLLNRCLLLNPTPHDGYFQDLGLLSMLNGDHDKAASYFELMAAETLWGLLYDAANAELGAFASVGKASAACDALRRVWPGERAFAMDDVIEWIASHHPFQVEETSTRFLRAVRLVFNRAAS